MQRRGNYNREMVGEREGGWGVGGLLSMVLLSEFRMRWVGSSLGHRNGEAWRNVAKEERGDEGFDSELVKFLLRIMV